MKEKKKTPRTKVSLNVRDKPRLYIKTKKKRIHIAASVMACSIGFSPTAKIKNKLSSNIQIKPRKQISR